ncbi:diacylglycerol kinase [Mycolicibacterium brumae]|uniref:Diacylglycerol kinase n=1 Tax=Mycolicibacterium brumae TaxID=85968 RepID=A0A2G5PE62_9MYCO|nr:diacylglycerol kinase [Mycolicibacterium brumae]PIB76622.1 diacylglycerol kinase [Mycolicibacterium brumae]
MERVSVLANPTSGHGNGEHAAEVAITRFHQLGIDVRAVVGRDAAHARELVDEELAAGTDAMVVVGGDGIIHLALQSLAGGDVPLGIIPAGTGNDHAREFGLPTKDPAAAADVVAAGWAETIDLGRVDRDGAPPTWFGSVMASGFDSLVSDRTNRMTWPHGRMRYNLAIVAELTKLRMLHYRLTFDDGDPIETDLTLVAFGNTRSYGGGMRICPGADRSDGLLDVTMTNSASRLKLITLFPKVFSGKHVELDEVITTRVRTARVECPGINAYADGELIGPLPVTVSAVPGALRVILPPVG